MKCISLAIAGFLWFTVSNGQVPVSREPRHHNVLDNGHVRLLDVCIPPGDTTQFHIHATPSIFVVLTDARTGSQVLSEEDHTASPITHYGNVWFEGFYQKPRIHRVYNTDTHLFNVMDIELTNTDFRIIDSPIRQKMFMFLFEEKPVRAYRVNLPDGQMVSVPPRKADILIIQLSDSSHKPGAMVFIPDDRLSGVSPFYKKGSYVYVVAGTPFTLKNEGSDQGVFAFFELK